MMGLVVKQVNDRGSERVVKFLPGIILITERSVEPLRRNPVKELFDLAVGLAALRRSSSKFAYSSSSSEANGHGFPLKRAIQPRSVRSRWLKVP
jgi:hypothetical protein